MKKRLVPDIITPNKITTFRMICVGLLVFILLFPWGYFNVNLSGGNDEINFQYLIAFILFVIASLSDYFDGHLARKYNMVSNFGKFMDPIADKLLVNSSFIILMVQGENKFRVLPIIVVIMISRDIIVDVIRMLAVEQGKVIPANIWGKLKTVLQMIALIAIFGCNAMVNFMDNSLINFFGIFCLILSCLAAIASFMSGIIYISKSLFLFVDKKDEKKEEE